MHHESDISKHTQLPAFSLLGTRINRGSLQEFLDAIMRLSEQGQSSFVCFANVHMLVEASSDPDFLNTLNAASLICPDGRPIGWVSRLLYSIHQAQIAGPDILPLILARAAIEKKKIFIIGTTDEILDAFRQRATDTYGKCIIAGTFSPPFRPLHEDEIDQIIDSINTSRADLVFVALGCPKQEKWMHANLGRINACMLGLGYAIPVYAGFAKRAPQFVIDSGLEWAYRIIQDPKRLFSRYMRTNARFILKILCLRFRLSQRKCSPNA